MPVSEMTLLGWFHTAACMVALVAGATQLCSEKGTAAHALRGKVYFWSMVIAFGTTLFLYSVDVVIRPGQKPLIGPYFGVFHWLAMFTLLLVVLGYVSAKRQGRTFFAYGHPVFMILSYWLLVGGGINEAFARIGWLQELALVVSPGAKTLAEYKLVHWFQFANHAIALIALVAAIAGVRRLRRGAGQVRCA
jgi:uncharacterized membrane protein